VAGLGWQDSNGIKFHKKEGHRANYSLPGTKYRLRLCAAVPALNGVEQKHTQFFTKLIKTELEIDAKYLKHPEKSDYPRRKLSGVPRSNLRGGEYKMGSNCDLGIISMTQAKVSRLDDQWNKYPIGHFCQVENICVNSASVEEMLPNEFQQDMMNCLQTQASTNGSLSNTFREMIEDCEYAAWRDGMRVQRNLLAKTVGQAQGANNEREREAPRAAATSEVLSAGIHTEGVQPSKDRTKTAKGTAKAAGDEHHANEYPDIADIRFTDQQQPALTVDSGLAGHTWELMKECMADGDITKILVLRNEDAPPSTAVSAGLSMPEHQPLASSTIVWCGLSTVGQIDDSDDSDDDDLLSKAARAKKPSKLKTAEAGDQRDKANYADEKADAMEMEVMMSHSQNTVMYHDDAQEGTNTSFKYRYKEFFRNCFQYDEDYIFTHARETKMEDCLHSLQCIAKGRFSEVDISALEPFFPDDASSMVAESKVLINACMSLLMMRSSRVRVPDLRKKETKEVGDHRLDYHLFKEETHALWQSVFKRDITHTEWTLLQCIVQISAGNEKSVALLLSKLEIPKCLPNSVIRAIVALRLGPVDGPSGDVVIELAEKFGRRMSPALLNGMLCLCHPDSAALKCFPPLARQLKLVRATTNIFDGILRLIKTSFPSPALAERLGVDNKLLAMIVSVATAKELDSKKHGMILQMLCDRIGDAAKRRAAKEYKLPSITYSNFNVEVVARLYDVICGRNITKLKAGVLKTVGAETQEEREAEQSLADLDGELLIPKNPFGSWNPSREHGRSNMSLGARLKVMTPGTELPLEAFAKFEDWEVLLKKEREQRVAWEKDLGRRLKMVNSIVTLCAPHEKPLRLEKHWAATALASRLMEKVGMVVSLGATDTTLRKDKLISGLAGATRSLQDNKSFVTKNAGRGLQSLSRPQDYASNAVGAAQVLRGGAVGAGAAGAKLSMGVANGGVGAALSGAQAIKSQASSAFTNPTSAASGDGSDSDDDIAKDRKSKQERTHRDFKKKAIMKKEATQKQMFGGVLLLLRAGRLENEAIVGIARAVNRSESDVFTNELKKVLTAFRVKNGKPKVTEDAKHFTSSDSSYADRILFFSEQIRESLAYAIDYCQKRGKRRMGPPVKESKQVRKGEAFPLPETSIMPREFREGKAAPQLAEQIAIISQCMRIPGSAESAGGSNRADQAVELETLVSDYLAALAEVFQLGSLATKFTNVQSDPKRQGGGK
jgi:hypothetical protein